MQRSVGGGWNGVTGRQFNAKTSISRAERKDRRHLGISSTVTISEQR